MDQWVRWEQGINYRYSPGDSVMLVVALEQIRVVEKTGLSPFIELRGTCGLVLKTP